MSNRLTIEVYGTRYSITTTEDPKHVQMLAWEINEKLSNMMRQEGLSLNQAMLLMSLHYLNELKKSEESTDHMREQLSEYLKDAANAKEELAALRRKLDQLEQQQRNEYRR